MPNWCENELKIEGPKKELEKFIEGAKGKNEGILLDMNNFIPYPEEFRKQDEMAEEYKRKYEEVVIEMSNEERREYLKRHDWMKDGYNSGGYDWCYENWGTKWNFCDTELIYDEDEMLFYTFNTAWSPPEPIIIKMGEMFPELTFELRYFNCRRAFNGLLRIKKGEVVIDDCARYYGHRGG